MMSREQISARINKLLRLESDWNGYGALPIDHEVVERVQGFLSRLEEDQLPGFICPTSDGGIQIEYGNIMAYHNYLEIEFLPNGLLEFYAEFPNGREECWEAFSEDQIYRVILDFIELNK